MVILAEILNLNLTMVRLYCFAYDHLKEKDPQFIINLNENYNWQQLLTSLQTLKWKNTYDLVNSYDAVNGRCSLQWKSDGG